MWWHAARPPINGQHDLTVKGFLHENRYRLRVPSAPSQRSAVPLEQQSVLPAVRGLPWWGAVVVATVITGIGAVIDASNTDTLGSVFKFCYLLGCVVAALAVRRRALFTAAAQPPLIAFLVGVITLYGLNSDAASSGFKSLIFKVLLPIANIFPWLALTFLVTLALVLARWFLTRDRATATPARPTPSGAGDKETRSASASRASAGTKAGTKSAATGRTDQTGGRRRRAAPPRGAQPKKRARAGEMPQPDTDRPRKPKPSAQRSADRPATATQSDVRPSTNKQPTDKQAAVRKAASPRPATSPKGSVGVDTPAARPTKKRATAGAVLRAESGEQIEAVDVVEAPIPAPPRRPSTQRPEASA